MIIGIVPVKNGAWILNQNLCSLSAFCDKIIVGLDDCTDRSDDICNKYEKVIKVSVVKDNELLQNMANRRQFLLDQARMIDDEAIIVVIDVDEIVSSSIVGDRLLEKIYSLNPGQGYQVRFRELWFSPYLYRSEEKSSWSGRMMPFIWKDNGADYEMGDWHGGRVPNSIVLEDLDLDLIHFARVVPVLYWSRMRHYIGRDVFKLGKNSTKTNLLYSITRDEEGMRLSPVPDSWYEKWLIINENYLSIDDNVRNWFNDELLDMILSDIHGVLNKCDIWDFDWVAYFKLVHDRDPDMEERARLIDSRTNRQKKLSGYIRENRRYPFWVAEYWSHKIVLLLNYLGLYKLFYSWLRK